MCLPQQQPAPHPSLHKQAKILKGITAVFILLLAFQVISRLFNLLLLKIVLVLLLWWAWSSFSYYYLQISLLILLYAILNVGEPALTLTQQLIQGYIRLVKWDQYVLFLTVWADFVVSGVALVFVHKAYNQFRGFAVGGGGGGYQAMQNEGLNDDRNNQNNNNNYNNNNNNNNNNFQAFQGQGVLIA